MRSVLSVPPSVSAKFFDPRNLVFACVWLACVWVVTVARQGLKVNVVYRSRSGVVVSKDGDAVGLTLILDRGSFSSMDWVDGMDVAVCLCSRGALMSACIVMLQLHWQVVQGEQVVSWTPCRLTEPPPLSDCHSGNAGRNSACPFPSQLRAGGNRQGQRWANRKSQVESQIFAKINV